MTSKKAYTRPDTVLAVAGRDPDNNFGIVNPPVYHASTILQPTMEKFENRIPFEGFGYGRNGTPTQKALEDAVAAIEGAHRSIAVQSGLAAVTGAIVGFLRTGDHMLLTDNAYGPARRFANTTLKGFGVETTFFDPMIGTGYSAAHAVDVLKQRGVAAADILFLALVASPEGVQVFRDQHPDVPMFVGALDDHLDDHAYIVPGLGDAGDRLFGTKN